MSAERELICRLVYRSDAHGIAPKVKLMAGIAMRHSIYGALALGFCAAAAVGGAVQGPEEVRVESSAIDGIWSIDTPSEISIDLAQSAHFGPMAKRFCRVETKGRNTVIRCVAPDFYLLEGTAQVEGNKIHLAWGSALARYVIDATLDNPFHMTGTFAAKVMGIKHDAPEISTAEKLHPITAPPDNTPNGDLIARSLQQVTSGTNLNGNVSPNELQALGAVQAVVFLGKTARSPTENKPYFYSVYQVEFSSGERLCGLHQKDDATVDALICV